MNRESRYMADDWNFSEAYEQAESGRAESLVSMVIMLLCGLGAACFFGTVWHVTDNPTLASWLLCCGLGCLGLVMIAEWLEGRQ